MKREKYVKKNIKLFFIIAFGIFFINQNSFASNANAQIIEQKINKEEFDNVNQILKKVIKKEIILDFNISYNNDYFKIKNELFDIKIYKDLSFSRRFELIEILRNKKLIGELTVDNKLNYHYKSILGEAKSENYNEFLRDLEEISQKRNLKQS